MRISLFGHRIGFNVRQETIVHKEQLRQVLADMERDSKHLDLFAWNRKWAGYTLADDAKDELISVLRQKEYSTESLEKRLK